MDDTASKYLVIHQIEDHPAATIIRALRQEDQSPVLLKIPFDQISDAERTRHLKQEIELVEGLSGAFAPEYLGVEAYNGKLALISRDPGGELIAQHLNKGPLAIPKFLNIAIAVTKALAALHEQKIVHKGISPNAILYDDQSQRVSFIDLSTARGLGKTGQEFISAGRIQGEMPYISPEQTGRMNRPIDYRTDFYSLGATFYCMLTGHPPFEHKDTLETIHAHLARQVPEFDAPEMLNRIVKRLMRKQAENRYQSMNGLLFDLETCQQHIQENGAIQLFEVGLQDQAGYFKIPDRLYGRDVELTTLKKAFKAAHHNTGLVFIAGGPGIGKSALVKEFQKEVLASTARFVDGKFEELKRDIPYLGILSAIRSLIRQILTESAEQLEVTKQRIVQSLGKNGQVLIDVLPELERITGPQPEISELAPAESQDRFIETFKQLIRAVVSPATPLVIFLDDLQWADRASLKLASELLKASNQGGLLLIGGYRDNEVDALHPLSQLQSTMQQAQQSWTQIDLSFLNTQDVASLISDSTAETQDNCKALSEAVHQKTRGNPFYVHRFLEYLAEHEIIRFDKKWQWDISAIQKTDVTENVVDFIADRIQDLSADAQNILKQAACIGAQPSLQMLAHLVDCQEEEIRSRLEEPLQEGMIVFKDNVPFFVHDRVQEAAYTLLSADESDQLHYALGTYLQEKSKTTSSDDEIYTIVNHLNEAHKSVTANEKHVETAELNWKAGVRALGAAAFDLALQCGQNGLNLLGEDAWSKHEPLAIDLNLLKAEALFVTHDFEAFDSLFAEIYSRVADKPKQLRLLELKVHMLVGQSKQVDAVNLGLEAVRKFGIDFPEDPDEVLAAIGQEMETIQELLAGREAAALLDAPLTNEVDIVLVGKLILRMQPAAHDIGRPDIAGLMSLKNTSLTLKHGHSLVSPGIYAFYAATLYFITGDAQTAYAFSKLSRDLDAKLGDHSTALTSFLNVWLINHWVNPVGEGMEVCLHGSKAGYEMGDVLFGSFITGTYPVLAGAAGMHLEELEKVSEKQSRIIDNRVYAPVYHCLLERQMARALMGKTHDRLSFSDDKYDEEKDLVSVKDTQSLPQIGFFYCYRAKLYYFFGDYEKALNAAKEATNWLEACRATVAEYDIVFTHLLALTAVARESTGERRNNLIEQAAAELEKIEAWSQHCESNFQHKFLLGSAELAWLEDKHVKSIQLYNQAAESANKFEFIQYEALTHERAGHCYQDAGDPVAAIGHFREALTLYHRWGASAKVDALIEQLPTLQSSNEAQLSSANSQDSLDYTSVLKAAQAISGENEPDRLYRRVMNSLIENAGAERAVILLKNESGWDMVASDSANDSANDSAKQPEIPQSIIDYVKRSQEYLVLKNAAESNEFARDPYVVEHKVKSVICAPIQLQNELTGLIYLENNLTPAAFTESRLEVVRILASQAAISIRHAQLYEDQVQLANRLEELVSERTKALRKSLDDLKTTQDQLIHSEKMASLGRMASGIAHELRNPLNFVSNFAKINEELVEEIKETTTDLPEAIQELIETLVINESQVVKHSDRAEQIVLSLMQHSNTRGQEREATPLHQLLDQCIGLALHHSGLSEEEGEIEIVREYAPEVTAVEMIPQDMSRAFVNILTNAIEAMAKNTGAKQLSIKTWIAQDSANIAITDNGAGIHEDIRAKIFEPFFTTKSSQSHSGLGLSIGYDIITKGHQGQFSFESKPNQNTTFTVGLLVKKS